MQPLYKLYRMLNHTDDFEAIYNSRLHAESAIRFDLRIRPYKYKSEFELFYIPTQNLLNEVSRVSKLNSDLRAIFESIPELGKDFYIFSCLVHELQSTNEIEGVRSTKKEIVKSAKMLEEDVKSKIRFKSLIQSYKKISRNRIEPIQVPEDVRHIYDLLVFDEIDEENRPDGQLFIKGPAQIYKKSGTQKIIHMGLTPESAIYDGVKATIDLLNNEAIPSLIRIAVAHFYFGFVHPFYDGNGRTSRFISSMYLGMEFHSLTALSLSRGCNKHVNQYLDGFEISNSHSAHGEMNFFIELFLSIIASAQEEMKMELLEQRDGYMSARAKLASIFSTRSFNEHVMKNLQQMTELFLINHFFSIDKGFTVQDVAELTGKTAPTIRGICNTLLSMQILRTEGNVKKKYYFDIAQLDL